MNEKEVEKLGNQLFSYRACSGEQQSGPELALQFNAGLLRLIHCQQALFGELLQQLQRGKKRKVILKFCLSHKSTLLLWRGRPPEPMNGPDCMFLFKWRYPECG